LVERLGRSGGGCFFPSGAQHVTLQKKFSHQVQLFNFSRPARKTETGIANR